MAEQQHNLEQWPELLRQLAAIIGAERTLQLAAEYGGPTWTYVPKSQTKAHPWRSVITDSEQWAKVTAEFGGMRLYLPRGVHVRLKKVEIIELAEKGVPVPEIVRRVRVNERYVRRVLKAVGASAPAKTATATGAKKRRRKKRRTWKASPVTREARRNILRRWFAENPDTTLSNREIAQLLRVVSHETVRNLRPELQPGAAAALTEPKNERRRRRARPKDPDQLELF